ncbi:MAG TPA: tRNA preQ1(34) S-adenosylmethionine ribosyltransferase-isomerase QueA [Abditibacteriaceae bacterium]|jgi:S-adenosylmethionine:tRNA ribosyltransferase-isomerase
MLASDFDYHLPPELIAQTPAEPRDHARLMHLQRATGAVSHLRFDDLPQLLRPDDLLVFNNTRVLRARLRGYKMTESHGGMERGARVEALLLREVQPNLWEALLKPSARLRVGTPLRFVSPDEIVVVAATPVERTESGWIVRFEPAPFSDLRDALSLLGEVPLPPYITAALKDDAHYQTLFARAEGRAENRADAGEAPALESAAAPTAGLHFTPRVFDALDERGIARAFVTLAIGIGTFRPMQTERVDEHTMHEEEYEISPEAAEAINVQKRRGGRVVAIGTTAVRVLESAGENGEVRAGYGRTSIFIRPGYHFSVVDALLTNFHLPRSTLMVMISAFAGNEPVRYAYKEAVTERYRFFSFGDAMFIE